MRDELAHFMYENMKFSEGDNVEFENVADF